MASTDLYVSLILGWALLRSAGRQRMPLKISHRNSSEVPKPGAKPNEDLIILKDEMARIAAGMTLEIEVENEKAIRRTKTLVTRAANELGAKWQHWHMGNMVYARPRED